MPQLRFNEDGEWHDFAPEGKGALKAGPWFPWLNLEEPDRLIDHRVDRPRLTEEPAAVETAVDAAAAVDGPAAETGLQ